MLSLPFKKDITKEYLENYLINLALNTMKFVNQNEINILNNKSDGTSLSQADLELDRIIYSSLNKLAIDIPIISEERNIKKEDFMKKVYWLIDPIDGTSNYINGGSQYTINIALIQNGLPTIGLIAHPPSKQVWLAVQKSIFIYDEKKKLKVPISKNYINKKCPSIIISKEKNNKIDGFINNIESKDIIYVSSSLKFCYLASKKAILYPRFSVIKKWDIAAGHAILKASGGDLVTLDGKKFKYNYPSEFTKEFFAFSLKNWKSTLKFHQPLIRNINY